MQSAKLKRAKLLNIIKMSQYADDNYESLLGVLGIRDNRMNNLRIKDKRVSKLNE